MKTAELISRWLENEKIPYEVFQHRAFHRVEDTIGEYEKMGFSDNKSLFLRDEKKRKFFLVVMKGETRADLKKIAEIFDEKRLSFANDQFLNDYLKTTPGSVSPLGLIFDINTSIQVLFDQDLLDSEFVGFHPNDNQQTWKFLTTDFEKFLDSLPHNITTTSL